jgi:hypothetical protein
VLTGLRSPFSFAISLTGDLLAARGAGSGDPTICTVNRQGEVSTLVAKARPFEGQIDVSSDSKHLAATIVPQGGTPTANIIDFDTGFVRPVDVGGFPSAADRFLPDGRLLAVRIYSPNRFEEAIVDPEGVKPLFIPLPLAEDEVCAQRAGQATPDGRYLIFEYLPDKPDMENGLYLVDLSLPDGERHAVPVVATSAQESGPALSPDGKWFAYATDASGTNQVVVRAFDPNHPGARERLVRVSFDGGGHPFWSPDGTELFFLDKNRNIMGVEVTTDPQLAVTPPKLIVDGATMDLSFTWGHQIVDMMPDGQRFVYVRKPQGEDDGVRYEYTLNWAAELGRGASAHASR